MKNRMNDTNKLFFLRLLHEFKNKEIPLEVFTVAHKSYLIENDYIELTNDGYKLTQKGLEFVSTTPEPKMLIKYPLTKSGRVGSYNKVIKSMSNPAANALMCSLVNSQFMKKVDVSNTRVFVQSLINEKNYEW